MSPAEMMQVTRRAYPPPCLVVLRTRRERKRKERSASDNRARQGRGQAVVGGHAGCGHAETEYLPCMWTSWLSAGSDAWDHRAWAARETVLGTARTGASAQDGLAARPSLSLPVWRRAHRGSLRDDSWAALHIVCRRVGVDLVRGAEIVCCGSAATDEPADDHRPTAITGWATLRRWIRAIRAGTLLSGLRASPSDFTARQAAERAALGLASLGPPPSGEASVATRAFQGAVLAMR